MWFAGLALWVGYAAGGSGFAVWAFISGHWVIGFPSRGVDGLLAVPSVSGVRRRQGSKASHHALVAHPGVSAFIWASVLSPEENFCQNFCPSELTWDVPRRPELTGERGTERCLTEQQTSHNPAVAGSNPAPATAKGAGNGAFASLGSTGAVPSGSGRT